MGSIVCDECGFDHSCAKCNTEISNRESCDHAIGYRRDEFGGCDIFIYESYKKTPDWDIQLELFSYCPLCGKRLIDE